MASLTRRTSAALAVLLTAALAPAQTTYSWTQPAAGTASNWSAGPWTPGTPVSGPTTALRFNGLAVATTATPNSYTFTNDLGAFTANSLQFNNATSNATSTSGANLTIALPAGNGLTLDGSSPSLQLLGPANATLSGAGGVTLNAVTNILGAGSGFLNLSAGFTGSFGFVANQTGTGIVNLSGTNTFTGNTTMTAGYVQLGSASALGAAANTLTVDGGAVRFGVVATIPNNIVANQPLVIAAGTGAVSGTSAATLSGVISGAGGIRSLAYNTPAQPLLTGNNTTTGPVLLTSAIPAGNTTFAGGLTLSGANGALANASSYTLTRNASLTVGGGTANANRINDAAPIGVTNGTIAYVPVTAGTNETFGNLSVTGGLRLGTTAAGLSRMNFGSFTRTDNAIVQLTNLNFGTINSATVATLPTFTGGLSAADNRAAGAETQIGILPFASAGVNGTNPSNLVTYDPVNGLTAVPPTNATFFAQQTAGASLTTALGNGSLTNRNVHFTGAGSFDLGGANLAVNSFATTSSTTTFTNGTITNFSGASVNFDGVVWGNGATLNYPAGTTGYIHQSWNQVFTGTSQITGSNGLVVAGYQTSTLGTLTFENTAGNPFTGGLFVNGNVGVGFRADNQLGVAGGAITLGGGGLVYNDAANLTVSRPIKLNGSGYLNNNLVGAGGTNPTPATAATVLTLSGAITGTGALIKDGVGTVNLTGPNTYAGGTVVTAGTLQFTTDANLGAAGTRLTLNGGTVQPLAAVATARPIDLNASSTILNANALTLSGPVTTLAGLYGSTALPTLTKGGAGLLTLSGDTSLLSGNLVVGAGELTLTGSAAVPQVANLTVATNSTLTLDNSGGYNGDRVGDNSRIRLTGAGAVVSYVPPATVVVGTAERFGTLDAAAAGGVFSVTGSGVSPVVLSFQALSAANGLTLRGADLGGTAGNYTRILVEAFTANQTVIPNVFFANTAGTGVSSSPAGYDTVRGIIELVPTTVSGTAINNVAAPNTPLTAAFTTTGDATAVTGASVYSLTLDGGSTLTLTGGNAAAAANNNTPDGTLNISGGLLTSQNGAKTITSGAARVVDFGASSGQVTTTSNLTFDPNVTLTGTNGLVKTGAGALTVNGPYNVAGTTSITAGTLTLNVAATLAGLNTVGTGAVNLNAGAAVGTLSGTGGTLNVPAGQTLTVTGAAPGTYGGNLTGAGAVSVTGTGTLALNGDNAGFSGPLTTSGTGFSTTSATGFGTGPVALTSTNAARLLTITLPANAAATFPNPIAVTTGNGVFDINVGATTGTEVTLSGPISGTFAALRFTPADGSNNVLRLTNPANSFTGTVRVFEGVIAITSNAALGPNTNVLDLNATSNAGNGFAGGLRLDAPNIDVARPVSFTREANVVNTNGNSGTLSGVVSGASGLRKAGAGTLTLSNPANTFTGPATVAAGTLLVNGNLPGTAGGAALAVVAGAALGGTGTIGAAGTARNVTFAGGSTLAPGSAGVGTLTVTGNVTMTGNPAPGQTLWAVDLTAIAPNSAATASTTASDRLAVNGTLAFATTAANRVRIDLSVLGGTFTPGQPVYYNIASATAVAGFDPAQFDFSGFLVEPGSIGVSQLGTDIVLTFTPVPEPGTVLGVAALGFGAVAAVRRRRAAV